MKDRPSLHFTAKILLALGNAQKDKGLLNESIETYGRIANGFPTQPEADEATAQLGIQLAHLGRSDTASVVLSDYLRAYPKGFFTAEVLYENGMLSARDNEPLIAATSFEQLRTKYFYSTRAVDCIEALAESYQKTNQFDKAIALYRQQLDRLSSPLETSSKGKLRVVFQLGKTYDVANDTIAAQKETSPLLTKMPVLRMHRRHMPGWRCLRDKPAKTTLQFSSSKSLLQPGERLPIPHNSHHSFSPITIIKKLSQNMSRLTD